MDNDEVLSGNSRDVTMNMIKILANYKKGLTISHINAQSLNNKLDEFRIVFEKSNIDIVCVSETWLLSSTPNSLVCLDGYNLYRNDRVGNGGGVAIFIRNNISCKVCLKSSNAINLNEKKIEYIFIEILSNGKKMLVGCVYRPNKRLAFTDLFLELETVAVTYDDVIIAGDFNSNILEEDILIENMLSVGLTPTNTTNPTHHTATNRTLLDIFFVANISNVLLYDQLSAPCFSKHDLIFLTYNFKVHQVEETVYYRDFKNINYNMLQENYCRISWSDIYFITSVDEQALFLEENIQRLYEDTVPIKSKNISAKNKPWFSAAIKQLIKYRDLTYSRWKRFRTPELKLEFREARRNVNINIKLAKTEYYSTLFGNAVDSKQTWRHIKEIGIGRADKINCEVDADELNKSFTNIPLTPVNNNFYNFPNLSSSTEGNMFQFNCVNQTDVVLSFSSIKSYAVGCDNMHPKFIKILLPLVLPYITHLFNTIITSSTFPSKWKHAKIIPLPKTNSEFRPVAILCYLSKVLEKLLHKQMCSFFKENNLLTDRQSGFRSNHSCVSALLDVSENIRRELDDGKLNFLVLLDHSKAFDMVNHSTLIMKLKNFFKFEHTSTRLLSSYLTDRWQSVYVNNIWSNPIRLFRGVPQGSILGPLLFSLYANDLPKQLSHCKIHMYADDVQLYINSPVHSVENNIARLNEDLNNIFLWATANGLCLNPHKTKCIVVHKKTIVPVISSDIIINGEKIEIVNAAKNLGLIFNNNLTWTNHINSLVGQTYIKLRSLWSTQYFTPLKIRTILAKSYLIPGLIYGCELFANCDSASKRKLNVLYNNIIRYVYGLRKYDHVSNFSSNLYGVSFDNFLKIRVLIYLHKIIYTQNPQYLFEKIRFARSQRGKKIIIPLHRCLVSEWHFYLYSSRLWNSLPQTQQLNSNANSFKQFLFRFFV